VNKRGLSYQFLTQVMSQNPARTFGLPGKGTLRPGTDADIVIFDPNAHDTISTNKNASKADYSIYEGRTVQGKVEKTLVRGSVVAADGEIAGEPGYGEFIKRELPDWTI
jgi:dihydropyrimidinase